MSNSTSSHKSPDYDVIHFSKSDYPTKIGGAWRSKDGKSINVQLDLFPPNGRVTLSEPRRKPAASPAPAAGI